MKMTTNVSLVPKVNRRTQKTIAAKRVGGKLRPQPSRQRDVIRNPLDPCDNSSDSGLGFENLEVHLNVRHVPSLVEREVCTDEQLAWKRRRLDIKLESDDPNDNFCFPQTGMRVKGPPEASRLVHQDITTLGRSCVRPMTRASSGMPALPRRLAPVGPITLTTQLSNTSRDGRVQLIITKQPETQHRARYQTEGSRGAVKDRSGSGFPVVKLNGYKKSTSLQVFIGTDQGRVAPHMFYQACRVSGKNSTPCVEKKVDGTVVIEVDFDPSKEDITCDCVGILKERNVDVEHRFPDQSCSRSKKKSTRCRMVFRTTITNDDGTTEVLQVTSHPIVCTQPPGVPEICKKSLTTSPCTGGMELIIIGKNFLKDTRVIFRSDEEPVWEEAVFPDKEYLQQTHLICVVPPYRPGTCDVTEAMPVKLLVESGVVPSDVRQCCTSSAQAGLQPALEVNRGYGSGPMAPTSQSQQQQSQSQSEQAPVLLSGPHVAHLGAASLSPPAFAAMAAGVQGAAALKEEGDSVMMWSGAECDAQKAKDLMPPPCGGAVFKRRHSLLSETLKTEDSPQSSPCLQPVCPPPRPLMASPENLSPENMRGVDLRMKAPSDAAVSVADLATTPTLSMATVQQFVHSGAAGCPLPTQSGQSVEKFLSCIEVTNQRKSAPEDAQSQPPQVMYRMMAQEATPLLNTEPVVPMLTELQPTSSMPPPPPMYDSPEAVRRSPEEVKPSAPKIEDRNSPEVAAAVAAATAMSGLVSASLVHADSVAFPFRDSASDGSSNQSSPASTQSNPVLSGMLLEPISMSISSTPSPAVETYANVLLEQMSLPVTTSSFPASSGESATQPPVSQMMLDNLPTMPCSLPSVQSTNNLLNAGSSVDGAFTAPQTTQSMFMTSSSVEPPASQSSFMVQTSESAARLPAAVTQTSPMTLKAESSPEAPSESPNQFGTTLHDERSQEAKNIEPYTYRRGSFSMARNPVQHFNRCLHDDGSNQGPVEPFKILLQGEGSSCSPDMKPGQSQFTPMLHDETSNHPMDMKPRQPFLSMIHESTSSSRIAPFPHHEHSNHSLLQDELSRHSHVQDEHSNHPVLQDECTKPPAPQQRMGMSSFFDSSPNHQPSTVPIIITQTSPSDQLHITSPIKALSPTEYNDRIQAQAQAQANAQIHAQVIAEAEAQARAQAQIVQIHAAQVAQAYASAASSEALVPASMLSKPVDYPLPGGKLFSESQSADLCESAKDATGQRSPCGSLTSPGKRIENLGTQPPTSTSDQAMFAFNYISSSCFNQTE